MGAPATQLPEVAPPLSPEAFLRVSQLIETYGRVLDQDRLEDWCELFVQEARYEILSRENRDQGLPLSLMLCDSKDMILDRIYSLRQANIYNIHSDCHLIGLAHIRATADGFEASAPYSLFQSNQEGESRLYSVGRYQFVLVERGGRLMISSLVVVVDTGAILSLLATPI